MAFTPEQQAKGARKGGATKRKEKQAAQDGYLMRVTRGETHRGSLKAVDRTEGAFREWCIDPGFHRRLDLARRVGSGDVRYAVYEDDFPTFCRDVLEQPLPKHALEWNEALESDDVETLLILVPPMHAKTACISIHRAAWLLACDRTKRLCRISETEKYARKLIRNITHILLDERGFPNLEPYRPFAAEFGDVKDAFRQDLFYVLDSGTEFHSPSVEAKGIGSQIYGDRFHEIVLDDIISVDSNTPTQRERVKEIIRTDILSRFPPDGGKLICVATRVGSPDPYNDLQEEGFFDHVITQKAIGEDGRSLWPAVWPIQKLRKQERRVGPRLWALQYQQTPADDESAPFPRRVLEESKDDGLSVKRGLEFATKTGLIKVMGFDPAVTGWAVALLYGISPKEPHHRYVLDVWRERELGFEVEHFLIEAMRLWRPRRCVIEENNFQRFLSKREAVREESHALRCYLQPHQSGRNKYDPVLGVSALPALFYEHLIHVPWADDASRTKFQGFFDELAAWRPYDKSLTQDQVMSMWFAELGAKAALPAERGPFVVHDRSKMPRRLANQVWDISYDDDDGA